jgi:NTP pyrophosphatase (non-canonical NTP hydrolase)
MRSLVIAALKKYGYSAQVLQTMEECGELIAALNQFVFRKRISAEKLASEIADVEIMCDAMRSMVGDDLVDKQVLKKLNRLKKRLGLE